MQMKDMADVRNSIAEPIISNDSNGQTFDEPEGKYNVISDRVLKRTPRIDT